MSKPRTSKTLPPSINPIAAIHKSRKDVFRQAVHIRGRLFDEISLVALTFLHLADTNQIPQGNPRSIAIRAVAKENKLDLEIVPTEPSKGVSQDYLKINPLGRIPAFVGADGYTLTECMAIAIYGMFNNNVHLT